MNVITFDAHLIELDDLWHVQEHVLDNGPCIAFYKITYPQGNSGYFLGVAESDIFTSVSIGKNCYETAVRLAA